MNKFVTANRGAASSVYNRSNTSTVCRHEQAVQCLQHAVRTAGITTARHEPADVLKPLAGSTSVPRPDVEVVGDTGDRRLLDLAVVVPWCMTYRANEQKQAGASVAFIAKLKTKHCEPFLGPYAGTFHPYIIAQNGGFSAEAREFLLWLGKEAHQNVSGTPLLS